MAFAPNMYAFPGGSVDPRDADRRRRLGRAVAGLVGGRGSACPSRTPGRSSAPRSARCSRSVASCWPAPDESTVVGDVSVGRLGGRPASRCSPGRPRWCELLGARGLAVRSDLLCAVGPVAHAGVRAAPVRHVLLPRPPARPAGHPGRRRRVGALDLAGAGRGGPAADAAADQAHPRRAGRRRRDRRTPSRASAGPGRGPPGAAADRGRRRRQRLARPDLTRLPNDHNFPEVVAAVSGFYGFCPRAARRDGGSRGFAW